MDFNSNITIIRGSSNKRAIIINLRYCGQYRQRDFKCPDSFESSERQNRHVSCEYIDITATGHDNYSTKVKTSLQNVTEVKISIKACPRAEEDRSYYSSKGERRSFLAYEDTSEEKTPKIFDDDGLKYIEIDSIGSTESLQPQPKEQKIPDTLPVIRRHPQIEKSEMSKRCASVGPFIRGNCGIDVNSYYGVSMYELASNGWIYDVGDGSTFMNVLDLDNEINEISKLDCSAVVKLGDIKLIF